MDAVVVGGGIAGPAGQGANTALEDGVSVGLLVRGHDLAAELPAFDRARRARWVRDTLMRLVPAGAALRAGTRILRWQPPTS